MELFLLIPSWANKFLLKLASFECNLGNPAILPQKIKKIIKVNINQIFKTMNTVLFNPKSDSRIPEIALWDVL